MTADQWRERGHFVEVYGRQVFVLDEGKGPATLAILHGFPSFSFDYWRVMPLLTPHFRVVVHDHLGFGFSDKPKDYSYSLIEQADIALALWQKLELQSVLVLAHDYGTSIATELIARRNQGYEPVRLQSMILGNGSMLIEMAGLRLIQKLLAHRRLGPVVARLSTKGIFLRNMKQLWADPAKVDPADLDVLWEVGIQQGGRAVLAQIGQYILERRSFWHRWIGGLTQTNLPIHLLWATEDPVAKVEMAHVLHEKIPHSTLKLLPGLGHYPMLEGPEEWATAVIAFLGAPGLRAADL